MRIYTCYTDSHRPLVERHFLPSIPAGFDVVLRKNSQACPSGAFKTEGWVSAMQDKVKFVIEAIDAEARPFVVSDADVRFYDFRPDDVEYFLGVHDVVYQQDEPRGDPSSQPTPCAGFALVRPRAVVRELYELVLDALPRFGSEQAALSGHALPAMLGRLSVGYLPSERFWSVRHDRFQLGGMGSRLAVHHGNWVVGVDAKLELLEEIWALVRGRAQARRTL